MTRSGALAFRNVQFLEGANVSYWREVAAEAAIGYGREGIETWVAECGP